MPCCLDDVTSNVLLRNVLFYIIFILYDCEVSFLRVDGKMTYNVLSYDYK